MSAISTLFSVVFLIGPLFQRACAEGGPATIGAVGGAVGGMRGSCIGGIYPIVLLIFMYRKNVVDDFAQLH